MTDPTQVLGTNEWQFGAELSLENKRERGFVVRLEVEIAPTRLQALSPRTTPSK